MRGADRITVDAARLDPRSPSALKRVVEGNDHRSCRHKSCDQQPEETARHLAAGPAVPVEHAMVVREGRRLREADDVQHRRDGAPGWRKECARDEHQPMAEGRSREAGSERVQPGGHQLGPRLDGHGVISNNRHPVAWEVAMAARGREEILTRYRRLREISTRHHSEALRFVPHSTLLEQARRLGLTAGKMLVADSMDELTLAFDLCLYTAAPGRSRGIDRYARSAGVAPGSDEERMLKAMGQARFSVWQVERPHETAGLLVRDLMREEGLWLVDEESMQTRGGWLPIEVGFGLTERGRAGGKAGMACEVGGGAGARRDHGDRGRMSRAWRGGWPGRPRAPARRGEATHSGAPGRDGLGAGGRGGRAASRLRDLWTSAGQQGPLPCDVPLSVRRRAGPGPTAARLPLPRSGRAEELRCPRSRPGSGTGTGLRDCQVRGPGALRQGRGAPVRAAADQRGAERRHGPEQDATRRPGGRAGVPHRYCETAHSAGGRPRRGWA